MKKSRGFLLLIFLLINSSVFPIRIGDFSKPIRFPFQDSTKINYCQAQTLFTNNEILLFYSANNSPEDTIFITRSSDNGENWSTPVYVASYPRVAEEMIFISGTVSSTGRILIIFSIGEIPTNNKTKIVHSDDNGASWSLPQNVIGSAYISYPKITEATDGKLWIVGRINYFFYSTNDGNSWSARNIGFTNSINTSFDLISLDSLNYLTVYDKYDSNNDTYKIYFRKSTNSGDSWSAETIITETDRSEKRPCLFKESNGTLWLVTQSKDSTSFTPNYNIYQQNVSFRKSTNSGDSWDATTNFTSYLGFDGTQNICNYNDNPLVTFLSDRWYGRNQIWVGQIGVSEDSDSPPVLYKFENSGITINAPISFRAFVGSSIGIQKIELLYEANNILQGPFPMFDDGNHDDGLAGDNIWGINVGPFSFYDVITASFVVTDNNSLSVTFPGSSLVFPALPVQNKWLSIGSLHNWYSSRGSEVEEGYVNQQQYGLRWPGIYKYQDMQAAKGFWIGAANFTDENARFFPYKVVHVGPRVSGEFEFYQKEFKLISKFDKPEVIVNTIPSQIYPYQLDEVNPDLPCDRMIYNLLNTQLGITVERKIYQFSQEYHSNYLINEYTFTNTGNVDYDDFIELPNNTINGIYFYYLFRWAINANTRYAIGNATGWGINTMLDTRGDGIMGDPPDENFRAQYAWHGRFTHFITYDNIGGPLWSYPGDGLNVEKGDTVGRLGANQFTGVVTLHADKSASDNSDDSNQPFTTSWEGSDEPLTSGNDAFNDQKMAGEYAWMSKGHRSPRHAYAVEPLGNFSEPTGDPALGTPGGFSAANGYGPYTLGPGESITIVWAEAADGIDRETAINIGRQYKWGQITAKQKNEIVLTGKDSLFQTFRKGILNYNNGNGFLIPQSPNPPTKFKVNSGEDKVYLSWSHTGLGPSVKLFEIFRTSGSYDSVYTLIHTAFPVDTSFIDSAIQRGITYYYYIQSIGDSLDNDGQAMTPSGSLRSSRYYTQTYDPVSSTLTGILGGNVSLNEYKLYQNYPNPFNPITKISWQSPISSWQALKVFDVLGNEVATLVNEYKPAGYYEVEFSANGGLPSGVYFYRLQVYTANSGAGNYLETKKMLLVK
ncbi:MAG TPA: hypothetical protein DCE80_20545 [Ignavibacteriales bacterium]|nr:hypothetical protein [Ignavibacteriales bacterium]